VNAALLFGLEYSSILPHIHAVAHPTRALRLVNS
jgi:hypothetical protein